MTKKGRQNFWWMKWEKILFFWRITKRLSDFLVDEMGK